MNAGPLLNSVVAALAAVRLEAMIRRARSDAPYLPRVWRKHCVRKANRHPKREAVLAALRKESERAELDLIRRRLASPVAKRMNFLRVRLPGGGSHL